MLFEISKTLDKSSVTRILLAEKQTAKKKKSNQMHKTLIKLRFVKINPREKPAGSQLAKSNPREMLKKMTRENKSKRKFLSLR